MVLFSDASIISQIPPLRACWALAGDAAEVAITGSHSVRALFGTLNIGTGTTLFTVGKSWCGASFREHLAEIRRLWRRWRIVLFLDRGGPHTAGETRTLLQEFGIEVRWLPTACPELNPLENLWRWLKGRILCNREAEQINETATGAVETLRALSSADVLRLTGGYLLRSRSDLRRRSRAERLLICCTRSMAEQPVSKQPPPEAVALARISHKL